MWAWGLGPAQRRSARRRRLWSSRDLARASGAPAGARPWRETTRRLRAQGTAKRGRGRPQAWARRGPLARWSGASLALAARRGREGRGGPRLGRCLAHGRRKRPASATRDATGKTPLPRPPLRSRLRPRSRPQPHRRAPPSPRAVRSAPWLRETRRARPRPPQTPPSRRKPKRKLTQHDEPQSRVRTAQTPLRKRRKRKEKERKGGDERKR